MFKEFRRRWQLDKVKPGDGSALPRYRPWQMLSRSLFALEVADPDGGRGLVEIDIRHLRDSSSAKRPAALYRDGVQVGVANLPVTFPVPGGVVEVATTEFGVKRIHFVGDDGSEQVLRPHPRSPEGLRARFEGRFPRASALLGAVSVAVLLVGLVVTLATVAEQVTRVPAIAEQVGVFTWPIAISGWLKIALPVAGALAATERAAALRLHWLLRAGA